MREAAGFGEGRRQAALDQSTHSPPSNLHSSAAVLKDEVREEFGLRPVQGFEVEHTHKLGNPLVSKEDPDYVEGSSS